MMKRVLSFLLCLFMVLGLTTPAVQATSTEDIYIQDGSSVSSPTNQSDAETDSPDVQVLGPSEEGFSAAQNQNMDDSKADEVSCNCGTVSEELLNHSDSCAQKQFCIDLCAKSAMDIYTLWYRISMTERDFVKEYLGQYYPDTLDVLQKIWNSDMIADENDLTDYNPDMPMQHTGEASAQVGDIVVDAHGVPEGSSLTVTDPSKKTAGTVEDMAVELGENPEQLFLYDISVQNEETDNWQPDGDSVYMTLTVPGLKLHKYTPVYVIHVDDEGNASTIQASVDENGDITFFTDGFSTFAGFTVDFKYGDAFYSIDGMTEIKLSQLFDELKMPLYASDVADLQFTNEALVGITYLAEENDWLLTSLQPFTTQEVLTVTMKDGNVFKINVTDATAFIYVGGGGYGLGTRYDLDGNGVCTWYADGDGELDTQGYLNSAQNDGWSRINTIYIGGSGKFTIGIRPWTNVTNKERAHILINQIRVCNKVQLNVYLTSDFDSTTITDVHLQCASDSNLFIIEDGASLWLEGRPETSSKEACYLTLDGWNDEIRKNYNGKTATGLLPNNGKDNQLIQLTDGATGLICDYVRFQDAPRSAIRIANGEDVDSTYRMQEFKLTNCVFDGDVRRENTANDPATGSGGAIYLQETAKKMDGTTHYTWMDEIYLENCTFNGTYAAESGGALGIYGRVREITIKDCKFNSTYSKRGYGGAMVMAGHCGSLTIQNTNFDGCSSTGAGGAIYVVSRVLWAQDNTYSRLNELTITDCNFTNSGSIANEKTINSPLGGAISLDTSIHTVTITGCKFDNLKATEGAGICFGYTNMNATNANGQQAYMSNDNFQSTTAANDTIVPPGVEGTGGSNYYRTSIGDTTITNCDFINLKAETQGGALRFRTNSTIKSVVMDDVNFDGCEAEQAGSAIMLGDTIIPSFTYTNSVIKNCKTTLTDSSEVGGSFRTIGKTTCAATLKNITFKDNASHCSGGGVYWNAAGVRYIDPNDTPIVTAVDIQQCLFDSNTAGWYGGGIYCESVMTVTGCELKNNVSVKMGGGIALQLYNNTVRPFNDNEVTNLTLDSSTNIHHNQSKVGGGISIRANATQAIDNALPYGHTIQFNLGGAQVHHNYATSDGGGVWFNVEQYDTSTENGAANQQEVERFNKAINLASGSIYSNTAGGNGGGVYMNGGMVTDPEDTSVGTLTSNGSVSINLSGAAIYDNEAGRSMTGVVSTAEDVLPPVITVTRDSNENILFTKGTATATGGNGGGIYLVGNTGVCTIVGGVIGATKNANGTPGNAMKNIATRSPDHLHGGNGGGVAIFGQGRIVMDGGYVINNTADTAGGGIAVHDRSSMYLASGTIQNNESHIGGGISLHNALPYSDSSDLEEEKYGLYLSGGIVSGNKVTPDETRQNFALGGGICASSASVAKISDGLITQNIASSNTAGTAFASSQEGGGVAVCEGATLYLSGGTISENKAYSGGGMVLRGNSIVNMTGSLTVRDGQVDAESASGVIRNNYAYQDAGGVYLGPYTGNNVNKFTMTNGWIYENKAANGWGGGVYASTYNGFYLKGGYIEANTSNGYGGAIYATQAVVEISNGVIQGNTAQTGHGGAIYTYDTTVTITNGTIQNNTAKTGSGGGLYITSGKLFFYGNQNSYGSILNNRAPQGCGGGICGKYVKESDLEYLRLEGNSSKYGGGIYLEYCSGTTIEGGVFTKNYSNQGAGLFIRSGTSTITGGEFTWNVAGSPPQLEDGTYLYVEDRAAQHGGGIVIDDLSSTVGDSWVKILGGSISYNTAPNGGGIWLKNIASSSNKAGYCPSAIMEGGSITYNTANYGGGVLVDGNGYSTDDEKTSFTIMGGDISFNTANGYGGGVYATGKGEVKIMENATTGSHGTVSYNKAYCGGGVGAAYGANLTVDNGYIIHNTAFVPTNPAKTPANTGYLQLQHLYGAGGGVFVAEGSSGAYSTFTLTGDNMAIYDNVADFSGDDVFSNGNYTLLDVPHVNEMNLAGYGFNPEGWFEDYNTADPMYADPTSTALRMLTANEAPDTTAVQRYRSTNAAQRRYSHITPVYVSGEITDKDSNGNDVVIKAPDDASYVNKANAYVAMTLGIPAAVEDTVVVDYGVSVKINVLENDLFMDLEDFADSAELGYLIPTGVGEKDGIYYSAAKDSEGNDVDHLGTFYGTSLSNSYMKYGWAFLTKGDGSITYKRSGYENTLNFNQEETLTYTLKHGKNWFYTQVTVIPATTIYYEDNTTAIQYHTQEDSQFDLLAEWKQVGTVSTDIQDQDSPGVSTLEGLDADNIYGFDSNYTTSSTYSGGAIHKVTVSRQNAYTTTNARATFVFTGTGFDIISLCSKATGIVMVSVYEGTDGIVFEDDPSTPEWEPTDPYTTWIVDTYYDAGDTLYQVPIIKISDLPYGTYTAELYIAPSFVPTEHAYHTADFYLDAIRIYDPAGVGGESSQLAQDTYKADGEAWPAYAEIRNMFINQGDLKDETPMEGILFIDGQDTPTLDTYRSWGPNNEIYLKPGQSVAFTLDAANYAQNVAAAHLGLRGLTGKGHALVQAKGQTDNKKFTVLETDLSTNDLYYNITDAMDKVVTITNDGDAPISISTVKVTHTDVPTNSYNLRRMFTVNLATAHTALEILTTEQQADPVVIPTLTLKAPALEFKDMITVNAFFTAENIDDVVEMGMLTYAEQVEVVDINTADHVIPGATYEESSGRYFSSSQGIHAKFIGDTVYLACYAKLSDGTYVYTKLAGYSPITYAVNQLKNSSDTKVKQLVAAMLSYGAAAQNYFGYNTGDLANATLTEDQKLLSESYTDSMVSTIPAVECAKQGVFANNKGFSQRKPAVSFEGAFSINYFFSPAYTPVDDITLYYWTEADFKVADVLTVDNATGSMVMSDEGNNQYRGDITGIAAKDLCTAVYVAAVYSDGTTTWTSGVLGYSIGAYCSSMAKGTDAMADLAKATAIYGYHAKAYFG